MTGGGGPRRNSRRTSGGGQPAEPSNYTPPSQSKLDDIIKGNLSPQILKAKKKSEETILSKFLRKVGKSIFIGALIGALSVIPGIGPYVVPLYTAYKLGKSGKKVVDAYRKAKSDKEQAALSAGEREVVKFVAGEITGAVVGTSAELVGEGVKKMAQDSGVISEVAKNTNVNDELLGEMLSGSVENGIKGGFKAFSEFIIEGDD